MVITKELGTGYANDGGYYKIWQNIKEQTTFGGSFTWNKTIKDYYIGGFARFEYYNTSRYEYSVNTDGGMVVPGQWFVDNSKNSKKSDGGLKSEKTYAFCHFCFKFRMEESSLFGCYRT